MRRLSAHLVLALSLRAVATKLIHSLPEDIHAFPKFRVAFLNSLPVLNDTAQRWLANGLSGGELEFSDQPHGTAARSMSYDRKEIESGESQSRDDPSRSNNYTLEFLKLGPKDSYVCLVPKPLDNVSSPPQEDPSDAELTPVRSWALLKPLTGTCLYHQHGWFTYSYCHNNEIRQFKELIPQKPRLTGSYVPEEDPEWESYTLGRAPTQPAPGADLTVAELNAQAANLELAKTAGSRYLVQRWGDGTLCDKTGQPREVEVQFHCSMTTTDSILFVKETKTCSYVLVINTPRLCGEPGFKSRRDATEEAEIRCREIVDVLPQEPLNYPVADYPIKEPQVRKPHLPAVEYVHKTTDGKEDNEMEGNYQADQRQEDIVNDLLRQIVDTLIDQRRGGKATTPQEPTELVIELLDDDEQEEIGDKLINALRAAGYDVRGAEYAGLKDMIKGSKDKKENRKRRVKKSTDDMDDYARDEL
ncbi:hypothetical protein AGABI2DRAFT_190556 [Agaricus bisporus var. bisporus H97]|uniref:hypothetical protein n=1 Tax=Agaricus bisporus var. bisporus (strain H97 / ATCC MYA-4626 / FGSC 10389) TaxID=936046 RepID=UPI00029F5C73|nr:hypothetical protein AGABI2DRAFT_190556 [Agaricus bisporus var. bisporus H97]EKV50156.1 hypothetical protein AGABI2DRAFT_190556 [Agaricus bisporus var. bisporus H97]